MFIVTRTFRDANGVFSVGSVVDATQVRTFKSRLADKHIVDVNEQNLEQWTTFFKNRYNINISDILNEVNTRVEMEVDITPVKVDTTLDVSTDLTCNTNLSTIESDW